jgi:hypothetical protein
MVQRTCEDEDQVEWQTIAKWSPHPIITEFAGTARFVSLMV